MQRCHWLIILTLASLLNEPVAAAEPQAATYVTTATLPALLLRPPPTEGSPEWRQETDQVLAAQQSISPDELLALRDEQHLRLALMTDTIGLDFMPSRFPVTFAFLQRVMTDATLIAENDKQFWHSRRPYLTDSQVKLLVDPIDQSPAYPSGHTCDAVVLAEVLGMLYPLKLADLRARADSIATHRIEAGVHYPVDIAGGRRLAMLITGSLLANESFKRDLSATQAEIAAPP